MRSNRGNFEGLGGAKKFHASRGEPRAKLETLEALARF
jgi:hypothetical protein